MNLSINEKVKGAVFGYAVGDALGLGTEFMTRKEISRKYPEGLSEYSQIVRDAHRSMWVRGEYTNDTKIIILLIRSMCEKKTVDCLDFAKRLADWYDTDSVDLTTNMRWVLSREEFADNPFETADNVWQLMNRDEAPSDALGRALFTGLWNSDVAKNTRETCRLTHPNTRCLLNADIIATVANSLMWKEEMPPYEKLVDMAAKDDVDTLKYLDLARHGILADFCLDQESTYWYVRKALGAALWTLWHCNSIEEGLLKVVNEGGDADTNASLAAGMLGLKYGYSAIPAKYVDGLIEKETLEKLCEEFVEVLTEKF